MVEKGPAEEVFSNGLHIDNRFAVTNHPRAYLAFPVSNPAAAAELRNSAPAGIVFHTTESLQIPFESARNSDLKRVGQSLLEYVAMRCAYHYVIDRFGRVFRVVAEQDAANHAGYSVWADDRWLYINLNESFLGVSFEASTRGGGSGTPLTLAQVSSAALLTELLRARYRISAANCVTHMQVSVNPDNMRVAYHTDWASSFPFQQVGLPDNYLLPLPSLASFGFVSDASARKAAGPRLLETIERAEVDFEQRAAATGMDLVDFRRLAQGRYRALLARVKAAQHSTAPGIDSDSGPAETPAGADASRL